MKLAKLLFVFCSVVLSENLYSQIYGIATIDHVERNSADTIGNIYLTPTGGTSPYTYTWSPGGSNNQDLTNIGRGTYSVIIEDYYSNATSYVYNLGYKNDWFDLYGALYRNDSLIPDGQSISGYRGALSRNTLAVGTDGWMQYVLQTGTDTWALGFTDSTDASYYGSLNEDMIFGMVIINSNYLYAWDGVNWTYIGYVYDGDILKIERSGSVFNLLQNGTTTYSYTAVTNKLKVKAGFTDYAYLDHIGVSFKDTFNLCLLKDFYPLIDHVVIDDVDTTGDITLNIDQGTYPYQYEWLPGSITTKDISGKAIGTYTIKVKDANNDSVVKVIDIGYKTGWTKFWGTSFSGDTLYADAANTPSGTPTAYSINELRPNESGWIQYVVEDFTTPYVIGYSDSIIEAYRGSMNDMNFGMHQTYNNAFYSWDGSNWTYIGNVYKDDVIRAEKNGNTFSIILNGTNVFTTTAVDGHNYRIKAYLLENVARSHIACSFKDSTSIYSLSATALVDHIAPDEIDSLGGFRLKMAGGQTPYTYSWQPGSLNTRVVDGLSEGSYTLTVTDNKSNSVSYTYQLAKKVEWDQFKGSMSRNDSLMINDLPDYINRTAVGKNILSANTDGFIEKVYKKESLPFVFGFCDSIIPSYEYEDIDFGLHVNYGYLYVWNGNWNYTGSINEGDVIRVERIGTTVYAKHNGSTVYSQSINTKKQYVKGLINNSSIVGLGCSFGEPSRTVKIRAKIAHSTGENINDGYISVSPLSYTGSTTYTWTGNGLSSNDSIFSDLDYGTYSLTVQDTLGNSQDYVFNILYRTRWDSLEGVQFINDTLYASTDYTTTTWQTAISGNTLAASTDGEISWQIEDNVDNNSAIGFLDASSRDAGVYSDIDYGIYQEGGNLYYLASGEKSYITKCEPGDVVSMKRSGTTLIISLNNISYYERTVSNTDVIWYVKAAITAGSIIGNIGTGSYSPYPPEYFYDDSKLNWNLEENYDEDGNVVGAKKNYIDNLGRPTQHLVKNNTDEVFTSQVVYDSYGRGAIHSKMAYTGNSLAYQSWFMRTTNGQAYNYSHFDTQSTLSNPANIQTSLVKTLGNYFSDNNPYDAYQATADNPYSRTVYNADPTSSQKSVSKPGNAFKQGSGREDYSFTMVSGDELKYVFGTGLSFKASVTSTNVLNCEPLSVSDEVVAAKYVGISPDNKDVVVYKSGGKVLATCLANLDASESATFATKSTMYYDGTNSTDIHLPDLNKSSLYLYLPAGQVSSGNIYATTSDITYYITDLYSDIKLTAGTDYTIQSNRNVSFSTNFLNQYSNKSLMIRVSCEYDPTYISYLQGFGSFTLNANVDYNLCYGQFSKNYYDLAGAIRKSVSPKALTTYTNMNTISMATTYNYSYRGELIAAESPDQGIAERLYDKEGKLRFTQNAEQKANDRFSYVNYDKHGRVIEAGEYQSSQTANSVWFPPVPTYTGIISAVSILDDQDGLLQAEKSFTTVTCYTIPATADDIPNTYSNYNSYRGFRNGVVNYVKNANSTNWYNYDKVGRDKAQITRVTEPDFQAFNSSVDDQIKTIESTYSYYNGIVSSSTTQLINSNEKLIYSYAYDANYRPITINLTFDSNTDLLITNSYNKLGKLNRRVLGNNYQGVDLVYTLNGGLKAINHPGLDYTLDPGQDNADYSGSTSNVNKDLFGEIIEYYNGDYSRSNTNINSSISSGNNKYNGLVYGVRFKTRNTVGSTTTGMDYINYNQTQLITGTNYEQQELRFAYEYDAMNQLAKTTFQTYNNYSNSTSNRSEYSETGASGGNISYDKNGNLERLVRMAYNSVTLDDLTYTVSSTNNQLTDILDAASNSYPLSENFKTPSTSSSSSFSYNSIGQLTQSLAEDVQSIEYFPDGKVKKITFSNDNTTEYEYSVSGSKIKSKYYLASSSQYKYTWYVGPYIYQYDETDATPAFKINEVKTPVGVLRVNATDLSSAYNVYQVSDHLGNVRATFKGSGTNSGIEILSTSDYYAFGGELPGRKWVNEEFKFGYQGQEKNSESNPWYQFELRMYNQDIGRWFAPDPYGQFASPYIAMANNPVSSIDPDGGWVNAAPDGVGKVFAGQKKDQWDRDHNTGAYSPDEVQKRYDNQYENIAKHFLDYSRGKDITGYLKAVMELNSYFYGLCGFSGINFAAQNGQNKLTQNQLTLNQNSVNEAKGSTIEDPNGIHLSSTEMESITSNVNAQSLENYSASKYRIKTEGHSWLNSDKKEDGYAIKETFSDGTTVFSVFDKNGNLVASIEGFDNSVINDALLVNSNQLSSDNIEWAVVANASNAVNLLGIANGHNGLLIGNDEKGWNFISKEGRDENAEGGLSNNQLSGGPSETSRDEYYPSFKDFLSDPKNKEYNRFAFIPLPNTGGVSFTIETTMRTEAESYYHVLWSNCGTAVENSLEAGGFDVFNFIRPNDSFDYISKTISYYNYER